MSDARDDGKRRRCTVLNTTNDDDIVDWHEESRIRRRATRRGFQVIRMRGRESERRASLALGDLMLIDTTANTVALFAATFPEIAEFLDAYAKRPPTGRKPKHRVVPESPEDLALAICPVPVKTVQ
jgi:hypothetical protein